MNTKKKCICGKKMTLISGTWGHLLRDPYWICIGCGRQINAKIKITTKGKTDYTGVDE